MGTSHLQKQGHDDMHTLTHQRSVKLPDGALFPKPIYYRFDNICHHM